MRVKVILLLGLIQFVIGAFIALRPLSGSGAPLTNSRVLDMAFAAYFFIRGAMNVRNARNALRGADPTASPTSLDP